MEDTVKASEAAGASAVASAAASEAVTEVALEVGKDLVVASAGASAEALAMASEAARALEEVVSAVASVERAVSEVASEEAEVGDTVTVGSFPLHRPLLFRCPLNLPFVSTHLSGPFHSLSLTAKDLPLKDILLHVIIKKINLLEGFF